MKETLAQHPAIQGLDYNLARAPGRISFSKHCDYVNNDLLYFADDRSTYVAISSKPGTGLIKFYNTDPKYASFTSNKLAEEIEKNSWLSYPITLLKILKEDYSLNLDTIDLAIVVASEIPAAGGLSSSHALLLALVIAIANRLKIDPLLKALEEKNSSILKLLQRVEIARGFNSGLGDPAAQMLAHAGQLVLVRLEPELRYSYIKMPAKIAVITAPSFIHADKSLPEFAEANANIAAYKTLNDLSEKLFKTKYLGDALLKSSESEIKTAITSISDKRLRGLAIYALSEGARLKAIKENAVNLDSDQLLNTLGDHLNHSHAGERLCADNMRQCDIIPELSLSEHHGYYGASTKANDDLQSLANSLEGVFGSSISGAGLGGNNIILCSSSHADNIKTQIIEKYYQARGLAEQAMQELHISKSSAAAGLLV